MQYVGDAAAYVFVVDLEKGTIGQSSLDFLYELKEYSNSIAFVLTKQDKNKARKKRHLRVRNHISGTAQRPRLNVFRSIANIYAQVIDDTKGITLVCAGSNEKGFEAYGGNVAAAKAVGEAVAKRALEKGIKEVVFDRGAFKFHGRIKAVAEAAREAGLSF